MTKEENFMSVSTPSHIPESSIKTWLTTNEKDVLFRERDNKQNPYNLIAIGSCTTEAKTNRVFAIILVKDASPFNLLILSTLPGVIQNQSLKQNTKNSARSIAGLVLKTGKNVAVDTIGNQIFTDSKIILKKFQALNLDTTYKLTRVTSRKHWKQLIADSIKDTVKDELEAQEYIKGGKRLIQKLADFDGNSFFLII